MRTSLAVGVAALMLLSGCDWLGIGSSTPTSSEKARPGAERQVGVTNSLPAARAAGGTNLSFAPVDETRSAPKIGSVVQGKGGQKAQKEAAEKDSNQREARDREERARQQREADLKKAQADKSAWQARDAGRHHAACGGAAPMRSRRHPHRRSGSRDVRAADAAAGLGSAGCSGSTFLRHQAIRPRPWTIQNSTG